MADSNSNKMLTNRSEIAEMVRERALDYPIQSKEHFVVQMTRGGRPLYFQGVAYDPEFSANLVPAFFFPVTSEQDMIEKATELITARGLVPLPG